MSLYFQLTREMMDLLAGYGCRAEVGADGLAITVLAGETAARELLEMMESLSRQEVKP